MVIKQRITKDKTNIEKTCEKYRGSLDPWLPVKPFDDHRGMYIDEDKKRGYCINSKVRSDYHPNSLIKFEIKWQINSNYSVFNSKSGSSTLKFLQFHISGKFDQKTIKHLIDAEDYNVLKSKHREAFHLSKEIRDSKEPTKMLNAKLQNDDIFFFSFVRYPNTRYAH